MLDTRYRGTVLPESRSVRSIFAIPWAAYGRVAVARKLMLNTNRLKRLLIDISASHFRLIFVILWRLKRLLIAGINCLPYPIYIFYINPEILVI